MVNERTGSGHSIPAIHDFMVEERKLEEALEDEKRREDHPKEDNKPGRLQDFIPFPYR